MAGLYAPLPTLRRRPRGRLRTDRGRRGLLLAHRSGLSPHTPCQSPGALTRVAACTLALSPICDTLIEGFSHFVTSMTAPIASGWSGRRVGLAPTGKRRLCTAHTQPGHYAMSCPDALIRGPKKLRSLLPIARFKRSFRKTLFGELGQGRKTWENQDYA